MAMLLEQFHAHAAREHATLRAACEKLIGPDPCLLNLPAYAAWPIIRPQSWRRSVPLPRRCHVMVRGKLLILAITAFAATCVVGCMTPLPTPFAQREKAIPHTTTPPTPPATPLTRLPATNDQAHPTPADVSGVLDELEQVRALDPTAEPKLLAELRRTPPESWPLVAEQFRASLAYSQQLRGQEKTPIRDDQLIAASHGMAADDMQDAAESVVSAPLGRPSLSRSEPPSAPLKRLVDPHSAKTENIASLTRNIQANSRTATKAMAGPEADGTAASPPKLARERMLPAADAAEKSAAEPAIFHAPPDASRAVDQAVANSTGDIPQKLVKPVSAEGSHETTKAGPSSPGSADETWQQLVERAADDLSKRVNPSPATTAEIHQHVSLRMLRLLSGDTEKALEPIPHITPAEQDYWSRQFFALATYLDHHSQPDDKRRAAATVIHLDEAASHLRELGSLSLRNIAFCKNVYGYGAIEPYDKDVFKTGQQVSLYVEVENYHSESKEKGYCTLLGATYEILDDSGKRISGGDFPDVDDCCRSRRRDFHIQFGLTLPQNMKPGHYRLELVVKDRQSDKLGHATAPFEIGGTGK